MNVHDITSDPATGKQLRDHLNKYGDIYAGIAIGLVAGAVLRRKPKIDEGKVVLNWMMNTTQREGKSIYMLSTVQRDVYEAIHKYAEQAAKRSGTAVESILKDIAADYTSYHNYSYAK